VDLGPADGDAAVDGTGGGEGLLEVETEVGEGVVGHDPVDDDAVSSEPGVGPGPEDGAGRAAFVVEDLDVGQAAVVVDGGVDVGVADAPALDRLRAAVGPSPASWWDPTQLLDVDVDQVPGGGGLVAADDPAGLAVEPVQPG
jgi:hypothetical protein